jgi:hypothetical protein
VTPDLDYGLSSAFMLNRTHIELMFVQ